MMSQTYKADELIRIGRKLDWVPMWLWVHVIFRFGLYELSPISWITYRKDAA